MNADARSLGLARSAAERLAPPEPMTLGASELDGRILVRLVRRRIGMIVALTLALTLPALPVIMSLEPQYSASTQVLIQAPMTRSLLAQPTGRPAGVDLDVEVERIAARPGIESLIMRFGLSALSEFNPALRPPGLRERLFDLFGIPHETRAGGGRAVIETVSRALHVYRIGATSVVEVRFNSKDPQLAAKAATAAVELYVERRNGQRRSDSLAAQDWLNTRRARQAERLETARAAARDFQETHELASATAPAEAALTLAALADRKADLQRRRSVLLEEIAAADSGPDAALSTDGAADALSVMRADLRAQENELTKLERVYGEAYGPVVALNERIADLREQIAEEIARRRAGLTLRLGALDDEATELEGRVSEALGDASRQSAAAFELAAMLRVADTEGASLAELDQRLRDVAAELSLPAVEVETLYPATVPISPTSKGRSYYLVIVLIAAGMVSLTIAGLRDLFDSRMRSHADLDPLARVRPAGVLPLAPKRLLARLPLVILRQPDSFFADSISALLKTIETEARIRPLRSLAVTSARRGEGASTVAQALALALAASERPALLVTCDAGRSSRLPFLRGFGGGVRKPGEGQDVIDLIRVDPRTGVEHVRRAGPGTGFFPAPEEVAAIMTRADAKKMTVIFDAPAILSGTAARLPEGLSDLTLLVVRWNATPRRLVALAVERLHVAPGAMVLTVLNAVNYRRHARYGVPDAAAFAALAKVSRT